MNIFNRKNLYLFVLLLGIVLGVLSIVFLYAQNWKIIIESFKTHEGSFGVVFIISSRMLILSGMAFYTFIKWFKQEEHYFSDLPFLFGLFFLLLVFGKALDLFNDFIYFQLEESIVLVLLKVRFFILILDLLPMIYLSSEMILFSFSLRPRFKKLTNEKMRNEVSLRIILLVLIFETVAGIIAPNPRVLSIFYPIVGIPSLITIVWLFYFARKNTRLSQVDTLMLTLSFMVYLISQISRPLAQYIIGESAIFIIIAETVDLIIFIFIFLGFYKEAKY